MTTATGLVSGFGRCAASAATGSKSRRIDQLDHRHTRHRVTEPQGVANMSKKSKQQSEPAPTGEKLGRREYEAELAKLQAELVAMQEWVKATGAKVCIVFEGRDTAGKGGTIKRIVE